MRMNRKFLTVLALCLVLVIATACAREEVEEYTPDQLSEFTSQPTTEPTEETTEPTEQTTEPTEATEETTEPTEATTEPEEEGVYGIVNVTDELRVRESPSTNAKEVGKLKAKQRVKILEQKTVNGVVWGRIDGGWVSMQYILLEGQTTGNNTGTGNTGTNKPKPTEPEETEPEETEPEVTEPEQTTPDITEPKPTEPEQTEPTTTPTNPEDGVIDIPIPTNPDGYPW